MNREQFEAGIIKLQRAFRVKLHPETSKIYWEKFALFTEADWVDAIEQIIEDADGFPKISVLKKILMRMAINRREGDQKQREDTASRRVTGSPTAIWDTINAIPFPLVLKVALERKIKGENTQEQLDVIVCDWQKDNPVSSGCRHNCEDGLVYYQKDGNHYVGSCGICHKGMKRYPLVDPDTCSILR